MWSWSDVRLRSGVDDSVVGQGWYEVLVNAGRGSDGEPSVGRG